MHKEYLHEAFVSGKTTTLINKGHSETEEDKYLDHHGEIQFESTYAPIKNHKEDDLKQQEDEIMVR